MTSVGDTLLWRSYMFLANSMSTATWRGKGEKLKCTRTVSELTPCSFKNQSQSSPSLSNKFLVDSVAALLSCLNFFTDICVNTTVCFYTDACMGQLCGICPYVCFSQLLCSLALLCVHIYTHSMKVTVFLLLQHLCLQIFPVPPNKKAVAIM